MKKISLFIFSIILTLLTSCSDKTADIVVWTDRAEIVSCIELFNAEQTDVKAIIVYKDQIATSIPPAKDIVKPDVIIGSLLKNSNMKKNFSTLNSILSKRNDEGKYNEKKIDSDCIYSSLLDYGKEGKAQYLLPVSFNLPVMIFSTTNNKFISDSYTIEIDEIKEAAAKFNQKNKKGIYTNIGFAPSWNPNFLYTAAKMDGADFHETANSFVWNESALNMTIENMKSWTEEKNDSTSDEQDFSFKYLYTPSYKQISTGRCLFAYSSTDEFFSLAPEQIINTDFRWLTKEGTIFATDDITTAGIYKSSLKKDSAKKFLIWLLKEENQKKILERNDKMKLGTQTFGICNGFSTLRTVNEKYFPTYYKNLIGNLPGENTIQSPFALPPKWFSMKERVLIPYLTEATATTEPKKLLSIEDRLKTWSKQFN